MGQRLLAMKYFFLTFFHAPFFHFSAHGIHLLRIIFVTDCARNLT